MAGNQPNATRFSRQRFQSERNLQFQAVRTFYTSSSPRPTGAGAGPRPDGKQPSSLRPDGLRAGLHLWAAGYVPVGRVVDGSESSPLAADRLGGTERRQPRCAPDPAPVDVDQQSCGDELAR
jgi:hypothetical protein